MWFRSTVAAVSVDIVAMPFLIGALSGGCSSATRREHEPYDEQTLELCQLIEQGASKGAYSSNRCHPDDQIELQTISICEPGDEFIETLDAALRGGAILVDMDRIEACRAESRERFGEVETYGELLAAYDLVDGLRSSESACSDLFVGTLAMGSPCRWELECREGLVCEHDLAAGEDRCLLPAVEGETCHHGLGRFCPEGFICLPSPSDPLDGPVCRALEAPDVGDPCDESLCGPGLCCSDALICEPPVASNEICHEDSCCIGRCEVCRPETAGNERRCLLRGDVGDSCLEHDHCRLGRYCNGIACQATLALGDACTENDQCDTRVAACVDDRCIARGGEGASCSVDAHCEERCYCARGVCWDGSNGDRCESGARCDSGRCRREPGDRFGICAPPLSVGDPCDSSDDCGGSLICSVDVMSREPGLCQEQEPLPGVGCNIPMEQSLFTYFIMLSAILALRPLRRSRSD